MECIFAVCSLIYSHIYDASVTDELKDADILQAAVDMPKPCYRYTTHSPGTELLSSDVDCLNLACLIWHMKNNMHCIHIESRAFHRTNSVTSTKSCSGDVSLLRSMSLKLGSKYAIAHRRYATDKHVLKFTGEDSVVRSLTTS